MVKKTSSKIPVLVLRDIVPFPGMVVPLFISRESSLKALEKSANKHLNRIILVAQKEERKEDLSVEDVFSIGTMAQVVQVFNIKNESVKVLVECRERVSLSDLQETKGMYHANYEILPEPVSFEPTVELEILRKSIIEEYTQYIQLNPKIGSNILSTLHNTKDLITFSNLVSCQFHTKVAFKQQILEAHDITMRLEKVLQALTFEIENINANTKIKNRLRNQIEKNHKDYILNEQLKAIHQELGDEDFKEEVEELKRKFAEIKLPAQAKERVDAEIKKLKSMHGMSAEAGVVRNYLEWMLSLPWSKNSKLNKDLQSAECLLNDRHFGLEKIKERIVEYLAVNLRTKNLKSPIICLVGPPGVGKTSLVKSIAEATGRSFAKISLGGVRDEAEIKGHRRTYIGAMPGRIMQAMKKSKHSNPVILLDEIDKMSNDYRGDPASAMLDVLDPEQNQAFNDHYIEVDYDLSQVMFIATANNYEGIPRPLLDRMEVINISGYTEQEKIMIAEQHLLKKTLFNHGMKEEELVLESDVVPQVIRKYTAEAGVRGLERNLAKIIRKAVKSLVDEPKQTLPITVTKSSLSKYLGVEKYAHGFIEQQDMVGITNGLAYSEVGGDLLAIESLFCYGKGGEVKITGKLGDVMQESAQVALGYIKFRAIDYGVKPTMFKNKDLHIHVPEGATPKDGPSAGIAMCTSIVSALTGIPVKRDVAMTGEITLRGRVLAIGGLKEKLLAALRGGVKTVLIPKDNMKDLEEIPLNIKEQLVIHPVEFLDEVLAIALTKPVQAIVWNEDEK